MHYRVVRALLAYLAGRDLSPDILCALIGVKPEELEQDGFMPGIQLDRLWANAVALTKDERLGLHFGEYMQIAALGVVGQVIQSSRTVGEALEHAVEYVGTLMDFFTMEVETGPRNKIKICFLPNTSSKESYPKAFQQIMDACLVVTLHELDGLVWKKIQPDLVRMPFKKVEQPEEYYRLLRTDHIVHSAEYSIILDGVYKDLPLITANYELQKVLLECLNQKAPAPKTFSEQIEYHLMRNAYLGIPSLEDMAANLHTSARSLQRKLQQEGGSYQQLALNCKKKLAQHFLSSGTYPVKEVSYLLGFEEFSSFSRAFKQWTGKSPVDFQRSSKAPAAIV